MSGEMLNAIDQFLEMLEAERGLGKNSLSAYQSDLMDLFRFLEVQKISLINIDDIFIKKYFLQLEKKLLLHKKSALGIRNTVLRRHSSFTQFFKFLCSEGTFKHNPMQIVERPKAMKSLQKI